LATPIEMPQAGSGLMNGFSDPGLANWSGVSFPTNPHALASILVEPCYVWSVAEGLVAVPEKFWGDLVFVKCFNCCLTVWQNIDDLFL
jgi:hypothetical protein